uniref:Uncharacterized protein n=1 Tax=Trichuris muris TaxID=70415 RepID=A0A5S6QS46_TRIMR
MSQGKAQRRLNGDEWKKKNSWSKKYPITDKGAGNHQSQNTHANIETMGVEVLSSSKETRERAMQRYLDSPLAKRDVAETLEEISEDTWANGRATGTRQVESRTLPTPAHERSSETESDSSEVWELAPECPEYSE